MDMKRKIQQYVNSWKRKGYPDFIPDEVPSRLEELGKVPSYRVICLAILKNETNLESLGFSRRPCDLYMQIKRDEIMVRGDKVHPWQPRLF